MFCSNCGQQAEPGRTYCVACGAALAAEAPRAPFPPAPSAPPPGAPGAPPAWGAYPPPGFAPEPAGNGLSIAAIVCGCIAVLILPIVLGPAAIILAGVALSKKEPRAKVAMGVAIGGTVAGFALGIVVATAIS
ncbi:MAG: hypothetical protein KDB10_04095 [Acidimicrobiales bacterium]|nr:hypothetical protein [Acidimicrobiales bacterium]MCB9373531.1 hypothetical protein [Microthrixaceae bacterium]